MRLYKEVALDGGSSTITTNELHIYKFDNSKVML